MGFIIKDFVLTDSLNKFLNGRHHVDYLVRLSLPVPHVHRKLLFKDCVTQAEAGLPLRLAVLRDNVCAYISNTEVQFSALLCAASPVLPASQCTPGLNHILDLRRLTVSR